MDKLYIIVPAYNESANITNLVNDWYPIIEQHSANGQSRLVIINDGSRDDTYEILCRLAESRPLLKPMTKPNEGHGPTVLYGYRYALKQKADWVFQTDADGQTNPGEFESFWQVRNSYDALFGNRTVRGDGSGRAFVEKTLCMMLRIYFGVSLPDANAPFRLMRADYLAEFLPKMPRKYSLPNVMLTTFGAYYHKRIRFIPISFKSRQGGRDSINIRRIIQYGWQAIKDFRMFRHRMHR